MGGANVSTALVEDADHAMSEHSEAMQTLVAEFLRASNLATAPAPQTAGGNHGGSSIGVGLFGLGSAGGAATSMEYIIDTKSEVDGR